MVEKITAKKNAVRMGARSPATLLREVLWCVID
jgi:hypothetical protein